MLRLGNQFSIATQEPFLSNKKSELAELMSNHTLGFTHHVGSQIRMVINETLAGGKIATGGNMVTNNIVLRIHFRTSTLSS